MKKGRPLKIGHLISNYFPSIGGAQACVHNLANKLIETGNEVVVITPARGDGSDKNYRYKIVRLPRLLNRVLFMNFSAGKIYLVQRAGGYS